MRKHTHRLKKIVGETKRIKIRVRIIRRVL